jgi:acyl-CoA thioesterase-1
MCSWRQLEPNYENMGYTVAMRVLVFGDSITQGFWDETGGWVDKLRHYYDSRQIEDLEGRDEPAIFNLGISADNSADILKRAEAETVVRTRHEQPPIVIIQIGVNDSCVENGKPRQTIEEYKNNLRKIAQKLSTLSSKTIFVGLSCCEESKTTPTSWGEYFYTNTAIKSYEGAMAEVAAELSIPFIPVFDAFSDEFAKDPNLLPDGLHPDRAGHKVIFEIVKQDLTKLLV